MIKNSIVKRWVFSVLAGIIILIVAIGVAIGFVFRSQYYNSVRMTLNSRASSMVLSYFNSAAASDDETFNRLARGFVNDFSDKNLMEVWVIDKNGSVVVSSSGFSVKGETYPDYDYAKTDENGKGEWIGRMQNGEKVMALTYVLPQNDNGASGAVRYIISLEDIDSQLIFIYTSIALLLTVFIFFVITSGAFFIRSIINPVKKINETADRIAKGDFSASIEKYKYNDEIGQLCDTINNMTREIRASELMKNEFISTVSHELRTPLTAIKGWGETVRSAEGDIELVDKGISVIVRESERLTELVEELLDFSRMESGKMALKIGRTDIIKELSEVLEVFRERSEREGILLITELPNASIICEADKNRLKQAFVNIIDNSFKYNKKGGFVKVAFEYTDKTVKVIISDNGCGISKNDLPRIREKFYKANKSVRGSGIGLAVTDEIIKLHGGEMLIESTLGQGTETTLVLPRKNNQ
ncbi:MAG: HAMP domain-containing histidine kinase [Oscillospiraceae bacterium]|nr:HAMP domain-containing histidine kinase [Oscillospiraceae bacterium]